MLDRKKFFDVLRAGPLFGKALKATDVIGTEAIIDASLKYKVADPHHVADVLAQVYHETGKYMMPIKETVMPHHKDKNPSDKTVIARLDNAYKSGKLPWVSKPYWRDGAFGRGPIQLTHWENYRRLGDMVGVDLVANPDLALDPKIGAEIAVLGMVRGAFTGRKLSDYDFPEALRASPSNHPRRIVNGKDGTDADIAKYHEAFYDALMQAGYELRDDTPPAPVTEPVPEPVNPEPPQRTRGVVIAEIEALLEELKSLGG